MSLAVMKIQDISVKNVVLSFKELFIGDRFQPAYATGPEFPKYTKIKHDQARCHSLESQALARKGFGYLGDPIVAVLKDERVVFLPIEREC